VGLSRGTPFRTALIVSTMLIITLPCFCQGGVPREEQERQARVTAADLSFGTLPKAEFSVLSFTLYPAYFRQSDDRRFLLPLAGLQWWVSPNLSILGGMGAGITDGYIVRFTRAGLRYLPDALVIGRFTPEFLFARSRIDGLNHMAGVPVESTFPDSAYWSKWNEYALSWSGPALGFEVSAGILFISQRTFNADGMRIDKDTPFLSFSAARRVLPWVQVCARFLVYSPLAWHVDPKERVFSLGFQASVAL
jgi:hypothetical protein